MALMSRDKEASAGDTPVPVADLAHYWAFISYSHRDSDDADWLHQAIERFAIPKALVGRVTAHGAVPRKLTPIFRDRSELAASSDLGQTIRAAIKQSRFLIVLCSPAAATSRWVNEEIIAFKKLHGERRILAAIVGGEPWASEIAGREDEECFPPALREKLDRKGQATGKRAEPIAADLRATSESNPGRDGREAGKLKLVAGMLGIGLDDLVRREQQRRQKRLTYVAAASLAGMTVASGLAVFAFDKRDEARDQRREAEGLVGFMLGDLRDKLEPIGRLDALDAVGSRALKYFERQDKSELSDPALAQRSKALSLMGEIATARGDLPGAAARYREAMAGTAEMIRRQPNDPQRLFDHAQNVYWLGDLDRQAGRLDRAALSFGDYKALAAGMVAADPANPKWQMEVQYAAANLGIVLLKERRYVAASTQFAQALTTIETLAKSDRANKEYPKQIVESLAWLADSKFGEGDLEEAVALRQRQVAMIDAMIASQPRDVGYREKAIPAHQGLGLVLMSRGGTVAGLDQLRRAVDIASLLLPNEPDNMQWVDLAAGARLDLAGALLTAGRLSEADAQAIAGCALVAELLRHDRSFVPWQRRAQDCSVRQAWIALRAGKPEKAMPLAQRALVQATALRSGDASSDEFAKAFARKLVGDAQDRTDDRLAARQTWSEALRDWPRVAAENPRQLAAHAELLERLGRGVEARPIRKRLTQIGYRQTY